MNTRPIRFFHRGQIVEVSRSAPTRSVLEWLREDALCTGTKEGCGEGDCGACTVVIGELPAAAEAATPINPNLPRAASVRGLNLRSVNACIQFLPTLDGKALFTVEDLETIRGPARAPAVALHAGAGAPSLPDSPAASAIHPLHPVQQAMVECHGSQCGFCTPGFVMSLWSTYERHGAVGTQPSRQQLADDLSGNLCRCTGYRPILDAGQRMFELPAAPLNTEPVIACLTRLRSDAASDPQGIFNYAAPSTIKPGHDDLYRAPRNLDALATLYAANPKARLFAGSTDVGLWVTKQFRHLDQLIYLGDVAELAQLAETADGSLHIGAAVSLETAFGALHKRFPTLQDVWLRFASVPIRNAGTLCGNIANGSPIGDGPPVLMALDAEVLLRRGARERRMPLTELYVDYMKNRLEPGEFVQAVIVPPASPTLQVRAYKISKRFDCDISAVCAGLAIELDGAVVKQVRWAFGGMAATVRRAASAEAAVVGKAWTQETASAAMRALADDFKPLTDMRASASYRLQVAQNLLQRLWFETRPEAPLQTHQTSVFSVMPHVVSV
jgi:xanthine dehydrogenase small subunit